MSIFGPRMSSYSVIPGEAQCHKEEGLPSWFLMVVLKVNVNAAKLEIVEAKCD